MAIVLVQPQLLQDVLEKYKKPIIFLLHPNVLTKHKNFLITDKKLTKKKTMKQVFAINDSLKRNAATKNFLGENVWPPYRKFNWKFVVTAM